MATVTVSNPESVPDTQPNLLAENAAPSGTKTDGLGVNKRDTNVFAAPQLHRTSSIGLHRTVFYRRRGSSLSAKIWRHNDGFHHCKSVKRTCGTTSHQYALETPAPMARTTDYAGRFGTCMIERATHAVHPKPVPLPEFARAPLRREHSSRR